MPIPVACPCGAKLNAPDAAAGKRVKCPKFAAVLTIPAPAADDYDVVDDAPPAADDYEVVDDAPPPAAKPKPALARAVVAKAVPATPKPAPADEADIPRVKSKSKTRDDDDEFDDEDDRPRNKKKSAKKKGPPVLLLAGAAVGVLLVLAVGGYFLLGGTTPGVPGAGGMADDPPPGFSTLRDPVGGYRCYVPGTAQVVDQLNNARNREEAEKAIQTLGFRRVTITGDFTAEVEMTGSARIYSNYTPGVTADQLFEEFKKMDTTAVTPFNHPPEKTTVMVDGRQGLIVKVRENPGWVKDKESAADFFGKDADPEFLKNAQRGKDEFNAGVEKDAARRAGDAKHTVYLVAVNGKTAVVVGLRTKGKYLDDARVKTVTDSFKFL